MKIHKLKRVGMACTQHISCMPFMRDAMSVLVTQDLNVRDLMLMNSTSLINIY
jgi:hypothetical protein